MMILQRFAQARMYSICFFVVLLCSGCHSTNYSESGSVASPVPADMVFTNGRIYTVNPAMPWVDTIAIKDGKYVYAGSASGASKYLGNDTEKVDLGGKMLMPGVNDGHAHPWQGGVKTLYNCNFPFTATPDAIAQRLRSCIEENPDRDWVIGGQWTSDFFNNFDMPSPRKWLDKISTEHAIYLNDDATHNAWVNSKALALAGVNRETPDPEDGTFVRDAHGDLNGLLYEQARRPVLAVIPNWTDVQYAAAITQALREANRYGLTGVNEARAEASVLAAYQKLDLDQGLTAHVAANHETPRGYRDYPIDVDAIVAERDTYKSPHLHTDFVKFFLDGVPTASRTAYMLNDYTPAADMSEPTAGHLLVPLEVLQQDLIALDKQGFTAKMHAAGDGSVRVALDAIEATRKANGNSGLRHQIAHAGFIDPVDLPRFAQLGATADLSPYIWYPSPIIDSITGAVGERGLHYFPVKQLLDSGATVLMGSDWPSAAKNLSPWHAIEALVTRRNPFTNGEASLWPEQAITLEQALYIATMGGAESMRLENVTGSIAVGKSADFIVLDKNLFDIPATAISETQVEQAWFEGNLVYPRR